MENFRCWQPGHGSTPAFSSGWWNARVSDWPYDPFPFLTRPACIQVSKDALPRREALAKRPCWTLRLYWPVPQSAINSFTLLYRPGRNGCQLHNWCNELSLKKGAQSIPIWNKVWTFCFILYCLGCATPDIQVCNRTFNLFYSFAIHVGIYLRCFNTWMSHYLLNLS